MTSYKNWKGDDIDISSLSDDRLVVLYRFLLAYVKHIRDEPHKQEMNGLKDVLKEEIKHRGLKMKNYT